MFKHNSPHKSKRVNTKRDEIIEEGYEWRPGVIFQIDEKSRIAITSRALQLAINARSSDTVNWRAVNNKMYTFKRDEFIRLSQDIEDYVSYVFEKSWEEKES